MKNWRFAFSRRWFGYLAVTVVFAIACVALSNWQIARRDEAAAENTLVETNFGSDPVALPELLPTTDAWDDTLKWRPVSVTGTYLTDEQLLVRNRPLNGNPGFEVLTPLRLTDGSVFIVDRGWLPTGSAQDTPDIVPAPPSGTVTVVARLKAGEPRLGDRSAPAGQIATVELDDIAAGLGTTTYTGAYGLLDSEVPAPSERPVAATKPSEDEGLHISYAFQWILFGVMGFFGLGWAIRQEYRTVNSDDPDEMQRAARREAKKAQRARSDDEVEDAILDHR